MNASTQATPIGVLISVYISDTLPLFRRAIDSVLNQSGMDNIDIRIYLGIDGPVNPEIEDYINASTPNFFKIFRSDANVGLACILNSLISMREDEYLFFRMDSDDYSLPERFSEQISFMRANPEIDVLGTDIIEDHGTFERIVRYPDSGADLMKQLCKGTIVAHPTVCFRSSVFDRVGSYPNVRGNEDIAFWFHCISSGIRFDNLHKPLLRFSVSESFWRRRSYQKAFSEFVVYARGCCQLHGFSYLCIYPIARLLLRLSPELVSRFAYRFRNVFR